MEINKILFLTVSILVYAFLSVFTAKVITVKFRKTATYENNANYYAIILSGILIALAILGKEQFSVLKDVYEILQKNNAATIDYLKIVAIFSISGIILLIFSYYLSFVLMQLIFEKVKINDQYMTEQFGYFLLLVICIISMSLLLVPLYDELLILLAPKLKMGLYN